MALIVHKYGGTSVGSVDRIRNVARRLEKWSRAGHRLVVVVSAMSGETNRLIGLAKIQASPDPRELDDRLDWRTGHDRPAVDGLDRPGTEG
jgi:aspartate kinase